MGPRARTRIHPSAPALWICGCDGITWPRKVRPCQRPRGYSDSICKREENHMLARKATKVFSALGTVFVVGVLIVASRSGVEPLSKAAAAGDKTAANALEKANAFLETLDAKQREK